MKDKFLIFFFSILVFLILYINLGFSLIRGGWNSLLVSAIILFMAYNFLQKHYNKTYLAYLLLSLFSLNIFIIVIADNNRNVTDEKIFLDGKISYVSNSFHYVYFGIDKFPKISFKTYNQAIRDSFKIYTPEGSYDKIPLYIGKNAQIKVPKSHYEWVNKPFFSYLFGFPIEVEIDSLKIIE